MTLVLKRIFAMLLACACLCLIPCASAQNASQEPLKVAVLNYPRYSALNEQGQPVGLAMDYLATLAKYTGWEYEYLSVTLDEAREMLLDGRLDLIPGRSSAFSDKALYADNSMGQGICVLVCRADDDRYAYQDYAAFTGMKVGVLTGSNYIADIQQAEETMGFTLDTVFYDTHDACLTALENKEVDALLMLNVRRDGNLKDIARFGSTDLYMAVSPTRPDVLKQLNDAHEQLYVDDPFHMLTLWERYYGDTLVSLNLTRAEIDYLAERKTLKVGMLDHLPVYSYTDHDGQPAGITIDLINSLAKKLGVTLEFSPQENMPKLLDGLRTGEFDIILPLHKAADIPYSYEVDVLPLLSGNLLIAMPEGVDLADLENTTVVLGSDSPVVEQLAQKSLKRNISFVKGHTIADALRQLLSGDASAVVATGLALQKTLEQPLYDGIVIHPVYNADISLALGVSYQASPLLRSAVEKTIATLNVQDVEDAIIRYTVSTPYEMSLQDVLYRYRTQLGLCSMTLVLLLGMAVSILISSRKHRQRLDDSKRALEKEVEQRQHLEQQREVDRRHHEELAYLTTHDELTGLYNANGFEQATKMLLEKYPEQNFKILRMDINSFKIYNDLFGAEAGEQLIRTIAAHIQSISYEKMCYARLNNDHFVVCIPVEVDTDEVLRRETLWLRDQGAKGYDLTACMGEYVITERDQSVSIMCDRAKAAMQTVKGLYPPRMGHYSAELRKTLLNDQWITANMRQALLQGEFVPYFQPQYRLYTGQITGAEVLVRWISKEKGFITPGDFIPIFEKNGFITEMDTYIWDVSCRWLRNWIDRGNQPIPLSINASRLDVRNLDLPTLLPEMVARYGLEPSLIRLEITESAYTQDPEQFIRTVRALQKKGFTIEMDDFGSGYSSLNVLKDVPVDVLKLDMLFLSAGDEFGRSASIIRSVVNMSKWLNLSVIAEGVETVQQSDFLKSVGCTHAQGYRYSKPISTADFEALLKAGNVSPDEVVHPAVIEEKPDRTFADDGRQLVMLLVEDDARRKELRNILGNEYDYIEATTGPFALSLLQGGTVPSLILLDADMPGMEDFELLRRLRSTPEAAYLPILTILPIEKGEHHALAHGASDFFYRPFYPEVVQHRVRSQLTLKAALRHAQTDGLTGLLNRTTFFQRVDAHLRASEGTPTQGMFLVLDLDRFKTLNDMYGHPFGDKALTSFADVLTEVCGDRAIIGRLGGDEFGILVPDLSSREEMKELVQRLVDQTHGIVLDEHGKRLSCSLGASVYPVDFVLYNELYAAADKALFVAKQQHSTHFAFYDELDD